MFPIAIPIIIISSVSLSFAELPSCSHGWIRNGSSCYTFISDVQMDWAEAMLFCKSLKANLVEIETESENEYLRQHLLGIGSKGNFWIGLNDILVEGEWVWMSTQQTPSYTDWAPGQPDNYQQHEDCAFLWQATTLHWDDVDCSTKFSFICEKTFTDHGIEIFG
ncbi:perlucin-like [Saccostrea cucullata]|uniref:perlucin-like n=1 Tax=Saccostrea cuccullata TaxID=36930 RepID=UPI002ED2720D